MTEPANGTKEKWEARTISGYEFGEVASALQKCIRRGMEEEALYWALELELAGYTNYLFKRLVIIACEDIGGANLPLVSQVCELRSAVDYIKKDSKGKGYDLCVLGHVILQMCRSPKSREADDFVNHVLRQRRIGGKLEIPDFALDKHTERGRKKGRGAHYFWQDGAKLANEAYPSKYRGWDDQYGDGYTDAQGRSAKVGAVGGGGEPQDRMF